MTAASVRHSTRSGLIALALAGCLLLPGTPSPTPASAAGGLALGPTSTPPQQLVPGDLGTTAGTGTRFVTEDYASIGYSQYTLDNGRSWKPVPAEVGNDNTSDLIGYGGTFAGMWRVVDDQGYLVRRGFRIWDPATGKVNSLPFAFDEPGDDDEEGAALDDYVGTAGVLNDGRVVAFSHDAATLLTPVWAATPTLYGRSWALTRDGAIVVGAGTTHDGKTGYLNVAPTDGSAGAVAVKVPGLLAMDVSAVTIHYLVGTSAKLRLCKALVTSPAKASCRTVASGNFGLSKVEEGMLSTSAGADQITLYMHGGGVRHYLVTGSRSVRVPSAWDWLPFRDSEKPMARAYSKSYHLKTASTVSASGKAKTLFTGPLAPAQTAFEVLSAGRISYARESYTRSKGLQRKVQYRTLTGGHYGPPVTVATRDVTTVQASSSRTAIQWDNTTANGRSYRIVFYDGTTKTGSYVPTKKRTWLGELSGPYAKVNNVGVVRADGKVVSKQPVVAVFGSLVVEASAKDPSAGRTFSVRDLARPGTAPIAVNLPKAAGRTYQNEWQLWGDWVAAQYNVDGGTGGALVLNYRTRQVIDLPGAWVWGLGDGWIARTSMTSNSDGPVVQVLSSGDTLSLPVDDPATYGDDVSTDELRSLIWRGGKGGAELVAEVKGLPASAPRLLGTLAPATFAATGSHRWRPQFDLTKGVAAGHLELRNAQGALVRTLATPASAFGGLRGISWDGRNSAGARVAAGTYTWRLVVDAADGSGAALSVDGLASPSGTVKVTR